MSRYTIRTPEFFRSAEQARYFPNTAAVIGISILIYSAYSFVVFIIALFYMMANFEFLRNHGAYSTEFLQPVFNIALFFLGLMILFTAIHVRYIEKRPLRTIGLVRERYLSNYIIGFGLGIIMISAVLLPAILAMPGEFVGLKASAFIYLAVFMIQSAGEEVLFRGYMLSALTRRGGVIWGVAVSSIVFGLFHIPYPLVAIIAAALMGAVMSLYVLRTGNLWGAMGMHAAWNYSLGLITRNVSIFETDYNFYDVVIPETGPLWLDMIQFAVLLAAAALLLFAGEKRLVVRKTQEQMLLSEALKLAKKTITVKGQLVYARRLSELAQSVEGKITALLYHAIGYGVSTEYIRQAFGEELFFAADSLMVRYGESPEDYWNRVLQNPAALSVKNAERKYEEIMRPKHAACHSNVWYSGATQCPMLRWAITYDYCRHIVQAVDNMASYNTAPGSETFSGNEEYITKLDHSICRACPARNAARYNAGLNMQESFIKRYGERM